MLGLVISFVAVAASIGFAFILNWFKKRKNGFIIKSKFANCSIKSLYINPARTGASRMGNRRPEASPRPSIFQKISNFIKNLVI